MSFFYNFAIVLSIAAMAMATEFASQLRKCRVDDNVQLNSCLQQTLEDLRPYLKTGIRELNLPPLEPMHIQRIVFSQGDTGVKVESVFTQVKVTGLSNFTTRFINADPERQQLTVGLSVPRLYVAGDYNLHGNIILLPISGSGTFWADFMGVEATGTSQMNIMTNPAGVQQLRVSQTNVDFTIANMKIHLNNLFNGDKILEETMNLFLNDHGREILQDVKPEVTVRLNELVQKVMNDALSQLPVSAFLITN